MMSALMSYRSEVTLIKSIVTPYINVIDVILAIATYKSAINEELASLFTKLSITWLTYDLIWQHRLLSCNN